MSTTGSPHATLAPRATLDALESGAVATWWQTTALLEVAGPDAPTFLDGLCTQAVERIGTGTGRLGLFLDAKAKIIAPTVVWRTADADWHDAKRDEVVPSAPRILLELPIDLVEALAGHLRRYRLRARVSIEPTDLGIVRLAGPGAAAVLAATEGAGDWLAELHDAEAAAHAFVGSAQEVGALVRETLPAAGAASADPDAWEAARIVAGRAGVHDLLAGRMPAEVGGMEAAVALDAGCYLGQEPVARLHYRGHANRTLRRLEADAPISPDASLEGDAPFELRRADDAPDARPVGRITTWVAHPDGHTVALGTVRRELAAGDLLVLAGSAGSLRVTDASPEA